MSQTGRPHRPLRIGLVTHYLPPHLGGIEVIAESLFRAYASRGCDVRWLGSQTVRDAPSDGRYVPVPCLNWLEQGWGVPWPVWGPSGWRAAARLVQWADVLHLHDCLYFGNALTTWLASRTHTPILLSQHIGFVPYRGAALRAIESLAYSTIGRAVIRRASHVAFCTPAAEEFLTQRFGACLAASSSIPYGIDTVRYCPPTAAQRTQARRRLQLPEGARIVLFAGRLVEKKGVDIFLEVSRRMPTDTFFLVGDGPLRPHRSPNLYRQHTISSQQMDAVYWAADALLLPSHGEGFPLSVLEAMASGVPVITSQGQAFATLLEREGACMVAERTPAAFCEALMQLWKSPERQAGMTTKGRDLVVRNWSVDTMVERYLTLLRTLAGATT